MFDSLRRTTRGRRGLRSWAKGLIAVSAVAVAIPASAQLAPGYSGSPGTRNLSEGDSWFSIRQLGSCLAQSKRASAQAFMTTVPGSEEEDRVVDALIGRETACLRAANYLFFPREYLRGSVAEGLYLREYESPPAAAPAEAEQLDVHDMRSFALCLAMVRPEMVHHLLSTTRLGQDHEREVMTQMSGEFGQCLPAGLTLRLDPPQVRVALAEAMYRRAAALPSPGAP